MSDTILITGAAQRLGLAIAEDLLAQNYRVIATYRTDKPSINALSQQGATLIQADFSTQTGIDRALAMIDSQCESLRAIVHNASDWASEKSDESDGERMARMMMIHTTTPYCLNKALAGKLKTNPIADIIHMTDYVQEIGSHKHIAYAASKAALHNLTLSFSRALAPKVKVNSIAPSLVMFNEHDDDVYRQRAKSRFLLPPGPGAQEAVNAVNYILNSRFITGQTIHLNGGRHLISP